MAQLLVLERGMPVMASLLKWCEGKGITTAAVTAIGAIENAEICYYYLPTKSYLCRTVAPAMEVLSFLGNLTLKEEKPFVHAHVVLGDRDMNVTGGHLKEAIVAVTLECLITPIEGNYVHTHNEDIGLFLIDPRNAQ